MSAFIQSNILVLLHPFIPFYTEKVWQDFKFYKNFKTSLMYKNWDLKPQITFKKSFFKIDWLTDVVTSIRSTKVDLNVSPGSFIEISTEELSSVKNSVINDNLSKLKLCRLYK